MKIISLNSSSIILLLSFLISLWTHSGVSELVAIPLMLYSLGIGFFCIQHHVNPKSVQMPPKHRINIAMAVCLILCTLINAFSAFFNANEYLLLTFIVIGWGITFLLFGLHPEAETSNLPFDC